MCTHRGLQCNYSKDHLDNHHHHGIEFFEVSGLSHETIATSCFRHDSIKWQNHALEWHPQRKDRLKNCLRDITLVFLFLVCY